MQNVVIHNPEILEEWLGPFAERVKQQIEGTDLERLFDEASQALTLISSAMMQMSLEDQEADATAVNNLGDAGRC